MSDKKKHSGSYYRKRRTKQSLDEENQAAGLKKFLSGNKSIASSCSSSTMTTEPEPEVIEKNPEANLNKMVLKTEVNLNEMGLETEANENEMDLEVFGNSPGPSLSEVRFIYYKIRLLYSY